MTYKFLPHTADIKFQASGITLEQAFSESAQALTQTIAEDIKAKPKIKKTIEVKGKDNEALLYNFLEEFLFLLDAENFLLSKIESIKIQEDKTSEASVASPIFKLTATLSGDLASNYKFTNDVKAITYNNMFVKKSKDKFICQVVLDV